MKGSLQGVKENKTLCLRSVETTVKEQDTGGHKMTVDVAFKFLDIGKKEERSSTPEKYDRKWLNRSKRKEVESIEMAVYI